MKTINVYLWHTNGTFDIAHSQTVQHVHMTINKYRLLGGQYAVVASIICSMKTLLKPMLFKR